MQDFAIEYRNARKGAGLTQGAVQQLMKIPTRTQQQWEAGDRIPPEYVQILVLNELKRHSPDELILPLLDLANQIAESHPETK